MSRGLGKIQRECLRAIESGCKTAGLLPTTYNIVVEVYQIEPDGDDCRLFTDAQYVAVKRALASLRRAGLIDGFSAPDHLRTEFAVDHRTFFWSIKPAADKLEVART
jgi:hypothetical protein